MLCLSGWSRPRTSVLTCTGLSARSWYQMIHPELKMCPKWHQNQSATINSRGLYSHGGPKPLCQQIRVFHGENSNLRQIFSSSLILQREAEHRTSCCDWLVWSQCFSSCFTPSTCCPASCASSNRTGRQPQEPGLIKTWDLLLCVLLETLKLVRTSQISSLWTLHVWTLELRLRSVSLIPR